MPCRQQSGLCNFVQSSLGNHYHTSSMFQIANYKTATFAHTRSLRYGGNTQADRRTVYRAKVMPVLRRVLHVDVQRLAAC